MSYSPSASYTPGQGSRIIYKPQPSNPGKGPVVLVPSGESNVPTITTADGQVITGRFVNDLEGSKQYEFPRSIITQGGLTLNVGGNSTTIDRGATSYEGSTDLSTFNARSKGSVGYPTGINLGGQYGYNQLGFGVAPADLTALFPDAAKTKLAKFKFTDPTKFAQGYAQTTRDTISGNYGTAEDLALKELNTELKGLESFAPAAAALKRSTIAADNQFNQAQRTAQVDTALPGVRDALQTQFKDAQTYASGRVPDSVTDNALTLNNRSVAADQAYRGGFGASSSVARKASDLLEASERIKLAQYGNKLLGQNIETQAAIQLAPTQYSNAGSQINVNPSVSGSQLAASNLSQVNSSNVLSVGQALGTEVQQRTFDTQRRQGVRDLNTQIENQFAMSKFGYQVGYAGAVAGAGQTDINTQVQLQQQQQYLQIMQQYMSQSQNAGTVGSITSGIGSIFGSSGGLSGITKSIGSIGGKGGGGGGSDIASSGSGLFEGGGIPDTPSFDIPDFSYTPF